MSVLFLCKLISLNIWVAKLKTSIVLRFCAYSGVKIMKRTFTFTHLNNLKTIAKKKPENQNLTRLLSGCFFFTLANALGFMNIVTIHDCWSNFTSQVAGPSEDWARNGNESTHLIAFFYELLPRITSDKKWNVSEMHFLHVKVAKSDAKR